MKQTLAMKKESAAPRAKKPIVVQAAVRLQDSASNHTQLSTLSGDWESQADQAAEMLLRGETGLAGRLSPAPAAGFYLPTSRGEALPADLLEEFEQGFGADLSAVRIHRDEPAAKATRMHQAHAFTSGRDIFLSADNFNLTSKSAKRVLAHELSHTLQQTGRVSSAGAVSATAATSSGNIQLQPKEETVADVIAKHGITFETLSAQHQSGISDAYLITVIELAREDLKSLGGRFEVSDPSIAEFEKKIFKKDSPYSSPLQKSSSARGFIYECLKFLGRFDGATALLKMDKNIRITYPFLGLMNTFHEKYGYDYFWDVIAQHPVLSLYWPGRFYNTLERYIYGPTRSIPTWTYKGKTFTAAVAEHAVLQAEIPLKDNELVLECIKLIREFDGMRITTMQKMETEANVYFGSPTNNEIYWRWLVSKKVELWGKSIQENSGLPELAGPIGADIEQIGKDAVLFWKDVLNIKGVAFEILEGEIAGVKQAPDDTLLTQEIPKALLAAANQVFSLNKEYKIPSIAEYQQQVLLAKTNLKKFSLDNLELPLPERAKINPELGKISAFFLKWILEFANFLGEYKSQEDKDYVKAFSGRADIRIAHRIRAARRIYNLLAVLPGASKHSYWEQLEKAAEEVDQNLEEGRSELAITGNWEAQPEQKMEQMKTDFATGIQITESQDDELPGFSTVAIVMLLKILYFESLGKKINELLLQEKATDSKQALRQTPVLNRAVDDINKSTRPTRWHIPETAWVCALNSAESQIYENSSGNLEEVKKKRVVDYLIRNHPKTQAAVKNEESQGREVFFPYYNPTEPFFWSLPRFWEMLKPLRCDDAGLNEYVAFALDKKLEEVKELKDEPWFEGLGKVDSATVMHEVAFYAPLWQDMAYDTMLISVRAAVRQERKYISQSLQAALIAYSGKADPTWDIPLDALDAIEKFGVWSLPKEEQKFHIAALMLELAPTLSQVLASEKRYDVITRYYGYVVLGIQYAKPEQSGKLRMVCDSEPEYEALIQNKKPLEELRAWLDKVRSDVQDRFGFKSDGTQLYSLVYTNPIKPNVAFWIDGVKYQLVKVHRKFKYNPAYGYKQLPDSPEGAGGYKPPMLDGKEYDTEYHPTGIKLFTVNMDDIQYVVTDKDVELLDLFSHVVEMQANVIGLEQLAENIEAFVETTMDLAELVPGAGQAFAAARMVTTVLQFLASGEFEDIKLLLSSEPRELLDKLLESIKEKLTLENLIEFILFGNPTLEFLKAKLLSPRLKRVSTTKKKSVFGRIVSSLKNMGAGLGKRLEFLKEKVQVPVSAFQSAIIVRPRLAAAIRFIANNFYRLGDLKKYFAEAKVLEETLLKSGESQENTIGTLFDELVGENQTLTERVQDILDGFQNFPLPERIVPNEKIIDAILELILSRLGKKGKITKTVLSALGVLDEISGMIADGLKDTDADPNKYWQEYAVPFLQEQLSPLRDAIVDAVFDVLIDAPLSLKLTKPGKPETISIEGENCEFEPDEDFPASQTYAERVPIPGNWNSALASEAGIRLPNRTRVEAENKFGHNFGHVRLHTGVHAKQMMNSFGALALTSGSHVFLQHDLSLNSGIGKNVLHHELAHVLQQTGPRVLTERHSEQPRLGDPGQGLVYNPESERAAEQIAHSTNKVGFGGSFHIGKGLATGIQPKLISLPMVKRILENLSSLELAEELQIAMDARKGQAPITSELEQPAKNLWSEIRKKIESSAATICPKVPDLASVAKEMQTYLVSQSADIIKAVPFLAERALVKVSKKKTTPNQEPEKKLHAKNFAGLLQSYLMAKTGLAMIIEVVSKDDATLKDLKITNILMGQIGSGSRLWDTAIGNSDIKEPLEKVRPMLHSMIRSAGAALTLTATAVSGSIKSIPIWQSGKFGFHKDIVGHVEELLRAISTQGQPADVPAVDQYTNFDAKTNPARELQISTHGDLTSRKNENRRSHHTTQYLLIQYFRNKTDHKPFENVKGAKVGWKLAGIAWEGDSPMRFLRAPKEKIEFAEFDKGERGVKMPAIYLAAATHETAHLHIKGCVPEDSTDTQPTQSGSVHDKFSSLFFTGDLKKYQSSTGKPFAEYVAEHADDVSARLFDAIQGTYAMMHNHMLPALEKGLKNEEVAYYRFIANNNHAIDVDGEKKLHKDYDLKSSDMNKVYKKAEENNDAIMSPKGWNTP